MFRCLRKTYLLLSVESVLNNPSSKTNFLKFVEINCFTVIGSSKSFEVFHKVKKIMIFFNDQQKKKEVDYVFAANFLNKMKEKEFSFFWYIWMKQSNIIRIFKEIMPFFKFRPFIPFVLV